MLGKLFASRTVDRHNPFGFAQFERGEQRDIIREGGGRDSGRGGDGLPRLPPCWCGSSAYQVGPPSTRIGSFSGNQNGIGCSTNTNRSANLAQFCKYLTYFGFLPLTWILSVVSEPGLEALMPTASAQLAAHTRVIGPVVLNFAYNKFITFGERIEAR